MNMWQKLKAWHIERLRKDSKLKISKLEINKGDIVILHYPGVLSHSSATKLKEMADEFFTPLEVKCMILADGITLSVLNMNKGEKP
jgi:hypothetical protein